MPLIGFGTCHIHDPLIVGKAISEVGYRMIDDASYYKNEE
jgi:diketogulonate reductase-like aldo/keto reductase